jgi:hypothetical protein
MLPVRGEPGSRMLPDRPRTDELSVQTIPAAGNRGIWACRAPSGGLAKGAEPLCGRAPAVVYCGRFRGRFAQNPTHAFRPCVHNRGRPCCCLGRIKMGAGAASKGIRKAGNGRY